MTANIPNLSWNAFWRAIFHTDSSLTDLDSIRQAQLLMALSLATFLGNLVASLAHGVNWGWDAEFFSLLSFSALGLLAYSLGRTSLFRMGSSILTWSLAALGYSFLWTGVGTPTASLTSTIPVVLVLGGILFRLPELILLTAASIVVTIAVPFITLQITNLEAARIAGNFFSIAVLLIIMTIFREAISRARMKELRQANEELKSAQDLLEQRVAERTLAAEMARMEAEAARKRLNDQVWENQGLMRLGEAVNNEVTVERQASAAIRALCQHLEAPAGGLFLFSDGLLQMMGGYAYSRDMDSAPKFRPGEGLTGQAALERRPVILTNPPPGYFKIASGLSLALPHQLVCWPFCAGSHLVGVIELGLMSEVTDIQQEFLAQAADTLARKFQKEPNA